MDSPLFSQSLFRLAIIGASLCIVAAGCSYESANLGDISCESDGDCPDGATCDQGYCLLGDDSPDTGIPDTGLPDADAGDPDDADVIDDPELPCQVLPHEDFCLENNVECGVFTGTDICGGERTVDCGSVLGLGCDGLEICVGPQDDPGLETNICRCPTIDEGADIDAQICELAAVDCGLINAGGLCEDWQGFGQVDCAGCEGDEECGEPIPNVCGCPCEINGQCYAAGDVNPDQQCSICDPDQSEDEFVAAPYGFACDDGDECTTSICQGGGCVASPICDGSPTECGCTACVDCTEDDGWYDVGDPYDCCENDQICSCQAQEYRQYFCNGTSCDHSVEDTQIVTSGCQDCGGEESCVDEADGDDALCIFDGCDDGDPTIGGGAGTADDPFLICTADHLDYLDDQSSAYFIITDSFSLSGSSFSGLGTFSGTLDGDGHTIDGLAIASGDDDAGFFEVIDAGATVKDLHLTDLYVTGDARVGALAATNRGTIDSVTVTAGSGGSSGVSGVYGDANNVGGLVAVNETGGQIHHSHADLTVAANSSNRIGGLVGHNQSGGEISMSSARGDVLNTDEQGGGFVGYNEGHIETSFALGAVHGGEETGGFVGRNSGTIADSYAVGHVMGDDDAGGFAGRSQQGSFERSYAFGAATGDGPGGFVGAIGGGTGNSTFAHCYWNDSVNNDDASDDTTGMTAADFDDDGNFHDDWEFTVPGVWAIGSDDRPVLQNNPEP